MKLCILENDDLDPAIVPTYSRYGAMFERLFRDAGATDWSFDIFSTPRNEYPESFATYDAVLLTGSKADSFSQDAWVLELRRRVSELLDQKKKLLGVCFGHQLIALCLGAKVGRAPQGWGVGRMSYEWHAADLPLATEDKKMSLLVSHQDQVLELPGNAVLLASNAHCPIAGYSMGEEVFCVQGHPEFEAGYSAFLLDKRRDRLGEPVYKDAIASLRHGHDGLTVARMMIAFVESGAN
jgi:GMP synthase-like glutamine amidotransferase